MVWDEGVVNGHTEREENEETREMGYLLVAAQVHVCNLIDDHAAR